MATATDTMLTEAIAATRSGDRVRARDLLTRLLRADSGNAEYWIWMSAVVDSKRERIYCLESALKLDPTNRSALRGLVILGARKPEKAELARAPKIPRHRATPVASGTSIGSGLSLNMRLIGIAGATVLTLGTLTGLFLTLRRPRPAVVAPTLPPATATQTATPVEPTATATLPPVESLILRTPIPTELALTPLAFFVPASPTPTPIVGVTPHSNYEAYRTGIAAIEQGDYEALLSAMDQVIELDQSLPDVHYFRAEALRSLGRPGEAIQSYDRAILLNSEFAPPYLGRGHSLLAITLRENGEIKVSDLPQDFDRALERDPLFLQAYIAKAEFYADHRLWKSMEETLQAAIGAGVDAPVVYIRLSEAQHNRTNFETALESAIEGSSRDPSNLEGYYALGRAYVELEDFEPALWPLSTYVAYRGEDHRGWGYLGRARYGIADYLGALDAVERSLIINDRYAPAYLIRGLIHLELADYQSGYSDLLQARRYGPETYALNLGIGRALYLLGNYVEALRTLDRVIEDAPTENKKAEGYAIRALVYEATNPPLLEDAIRHWRWILGIEEASTKLKLMAYEHLAKLGAEPFTSTPEATLTPAATPTPRATEEA